MPTKDLGVHPYLFPMPTYMIGTYNEDGTPDAMMMAWGGICAVDMVALNLGEEHKTVANLRARKAFTLAVPGIDTLAASDYLGIVSGNQVKDKFERSGLHARKSERVDAPVIEEYPVTLECELVEETAEPYGPRFLGRIVNVVADERVLDEAGRIDVSKMQAFAFDSMRHGYYAMGDKVGEAWASGQAHGDQ
ncbi:flavin reductase family protein [Xiamenia xianingshaonis]|uniref:Flavin oxidoreductase n=1 Tax=Xiamenia xianingshaonis TaxID=2682776 RepID=A0A9E6MRB1_9ACTN|nr:flavin reductase family protein [Xiamenia xianingshaonis]NGM17770.1 flavin oxidoreductase [Eggerthellaceae bacterium zg-893]NHM13329.1 flavin oxidoreductase [Xiamenia xianingshaonis]NHM15297.1 flavin oxidoreductase [Xiamenia xianingshaonis]QTU84590.1 flavin reductase family protein [Xiamenia xianingshaonis]